VRRVDGGKVTLRLVSAGDVVEYVGELDAGGRVSKVRARIGSVDGAVDVAMLDDVAPPDWLLAFVRATLRSAWRASSTGVPWPRRLSRWRPSADRDGEP
jgi:hypothetical protein